jgi:uncharacterized protein YrrD
MNGREANQQLSKPVIPVNEGKELGRVKDVLFDPDRHALLGVMVSPNTGMDTLKFVDRDQIESIGDSAITVSGSSALTEVSSQPRAEEIVNSGLHLKGTSVVTETGNSLGTVDKILIDDTGNITAYHASSGLLGFGDRTDVLPDEVISVGDDAIVVTHSAEQRTNEDTRKQDQERASTRSGAGNVDPASSDDAMRERDPNELPPPLV